MITKFDTSLPTPEPIDTADMFPSIAEDDAAQALLPESLPIGAPASSPVVASAPVAFELLCSDYSGADGFLFVGDPHLTSYKPGRRTESEHLIMDITADKFDQAVDIANDRNLVIVILGDLFDKAKDSKAKLMTLLFRSLRKARHPVLCLPGNHDLLATDVTEDTALAVAEATGLIRLMHHSNAVNATFDFKGKRVALGATLHDDVILKSVVGLANTQGADAVVWITHHDIAFDGAYPGALDPHAIEGCVLVVNGHMHRTQPSIYMLPTWWVNPGNIFRQTIADAKHVPAVWEWHVGEDVPERHVLRYIEDVFNWRGKSTMPQMGALVPLDLEEDEEDNPDSVFVDQLAAVLSGELPKSSKADVLLEDMKAVEEELKPDEEVLKIVTALHKSLMKDSV